MADDTIHTDDVAKVAAFSCDLVVWNVDPRIGDVDNSRSGSTGHAAIGCSLWTAAHDPDASVARAHDLDGPTVDDTIDASGADLQEKPTTG